MFIATFTHEMKTDVIGAFHSTSDAIKSLLTFLMKKDCVWCNFSESIVENYSEIQDDASPLDQEIAKWIETGFEEDEDISPEEQLENDISAFVTIVSKHVTTIDQCKQYIADHEDSYLNQSWTFSLDAVIPQ